MSGAYGNWSMMLGLALVMIVIGVRLHLLSLPELTTRCGACGRIKRKSSICPCTRVDDD